MVWIVIGGNHLMDVRAELDPQTQSRDRAPQSDDASIFDGAE